REALSRPPTRNMTRCRTPVFVWRFSIHALGIERPLQVGGQLIPRRGRVHRELVQLVRRHHTVDDGLLFARELVYSHDLAPFRAKSPRTRRVGRRPGGFSASSQHPKVCSPTKHAPTLCCDADAFKGDKSTTLFVPGAKMAKTLTIYGRTRSPLYVLAA